MSDLDLLLLILIPSVIVIGTILFLLAGVYKVKENQMMVIEKYNSFYGLYKKGIYFFFPNVHRRVGVYTIATMEKDIHLKNGNRLVLTYLVEDVKKYHYSKNDVEAQVVETSSNVEEMNEDILKDCLNEIGIKYISIRKKVEY